MNFSFLNSVLPFNTFISSTDTKGHIYKYTDLHSTTAGNPKVNESTLKIPHHVSQVLCASRPADTTQWFGPSMWWVSCFVLSSVLILVCPQQPLSLPVLAVGSQKSWASPEEYCRWKHCFLQPCAKSSDKYFSGFAQLFAQEQQDSTVQVPQRLHNCVFPLILCA